MRHGLLVLFIGGAFALTAREAHACGRGNSYGWLVPLAITGIVLVSADAVMGLYDVGTLATGTRPPLGYGVAEMIVAVPQVVLGAVAMGSTSGGGRAGFAAYTLWTALMAAHGVATIVRASGGPEPPAGTAQPPDKPFIAVGPTYVPLTNQPLPAFGLSGRF